tara:strand:- start:460 stop:648 length:189 start_codon:yes stop_codon:yes gene_type:complete
MGIIVLGGINGKTIYLVKVGDSIIKKTFSLKVAQETVKDFNFDIPRGIQKAKLFKATVTLKK